jgi:predicted GIY-YIG superfamily endonuclease
MPWEVVYTEVYETIQEAKAREQQVKSWKSAVAIRELIEGR